ncbi:MAG: substrate-binding domain-containing protein [Candidatus Bipolaricaulia bacterium]
MIVLLLASRYQSTGASQEVLVLATTTSTYDSGLLERLNPVFEARFNVRVKVIAVGTGAALRHGRDGDADVIIVHARAAEDEFLKGGWGINRRDLMFNDFVIIGPKDDPAGIRDSASAVEAFRRIAGSESLFISRGDNSGTNMKEQEIWERAGISPGGEWYLAVGKGMGDTIVQADQMGAYTLSDRGTFIALRDRISLIILVEGPIKGGDPLLINRYGVIAVNPARHPGVNYQMAMAYIGFLTSPQGQRIIADFKEDGEQLFYPTALSEEPNFAQYVPQGWPGPEEGGP